MKFTKFKPSGEIKTLYVDYNYRGKGLGAKTLAFLEKQEKKPKSPNSSSGFPH
jgi:GNAT superfamily N-acetyltransferase